MSNLENSKEESTCKICHSPCNDELPYVHPCKCKGSLKYIHTECLEEWLSLSKNKKCDICNYHFKFEKKFKMGTPKNVPFYYVILFILKSVSNALADVLCVLYNVGKLSLILIINSNIGLRYCTDTKSMPAAVVWGIGISIINIMHYHFFKHALSSIGALRGRIETSRVLQTALSDAANRSENGSSVQSNSIASTTTPASAATRDSESSDSDSQIYETIDESFIINLQLELFSRPNLQNLVKDFKLIASSCFVSLVYPFIYLSSKLFERLLAFCGSLLDPWIISMPLKLNAFVENLSLERIYMELTTLLLLLFIVCSFLRVIKTRTSYHSIKLAFGLVRSYNILVCSTVYALLSIGCMSHMLLSLAFNMGNPVVACTDTKVSFVLHLCFGMFSTHLFRLLRRSMAKKFRKGFIIKSLRDEKLKTLVQYCIETPFHIFILKTVMAFAISCFLPAIIFPLNRINLGFHLRLDDTLGVYIYFKSFMILCTNASAISQFFACSFELIMRFYSKFFKADNYLYNKKVDDFDKSCLVWAVNTRFADQRYQESIERINQVIRNGKAEQDGPSREPTQLRRAIRNSIEYDSSHNNAIEESGNSTFSRNSSRLFEDLKENEKSSVLEKYEINGRRIARYFSVAHSRKISIFYKPKHFWIFKIVVQLTCFIFVHLVSQLVFKASAQICSCFHTDESKSACFILCSCLIIILICNAHLLVSMAPLLFIKAAVNKILLTIYTNAVFPAIGALGCVFVYANLNMFAYFTSIFIAINAVSSVNSIIFENFFLMSPLQSHSISYLVRQICSFMCLKLTVYSSFMLYRKIIRFNGLYIPAIIVVTAGLHIFKLVRFIFFGDLKNKIKDYFFLERTNVVNYSDGE